jgi:hypothetical protein
MGKKKHTPTAGAAGLPGLRIGSRVRCTDDGAEGRIAWANAVSVKIKWDDGEEVTWRREVLAAKPIEFLDAETPERPEPAATVRTPATAEQPVTLEATVAEPATPEEPAKPATPAIEPEVVGAPAAQPTAPEAIATTAGPTAPAAGKVVMSEATTPEQTSALITVATAAPAADRPKRQRQAPAEPKVKKVSALDAAARVLAEAGTPLSCKEMIETMAARGYWASPGGKTPDATLHSAVLREIVVKGAQSRFVKTGPGRFGLRPSAPAPEPAATGA